MSQIKFIPNVVAILINEKTGKKRFIEGKNLVTNGGDRYYAEGAVGSPAVAMQGFQLGSDPASADVAKGDTEKHTSCIRVPNGGSFSGYIRKEQQPLASRRCLRGLIRDQVVNFLFGKISNGLLGLAKGVAKPSHGGSHTIDGPDV